MKYLKDTSWNEIFENWRKREASNPGWINTATEIKGWPDWESWRKFTVSQLGLDKLNWKLYQLTDPIEQISEMLIGPYGGWQGRVGNKNRSTFADLLDDDGQYRFFKNHTAVKSLIKNFPHDTEFIGLLRNDLNKIVLVEGHHRAVAVTLLKKDGKVGRQGTVRIALAEINQNEQQLFDKVLARGTTKVNK